MIVEKSRFGGDSPQNPAYRSTRTHRYYLTEFASVRWSLSEVRGGAVATGASASWRKRPTTARTRPAAVRPAALRSGFLLLFVNVKNPLAVRANANGAGTHDLDDHLWRDLHEATGAAAADDLHYGTAAAAFEHAVVSLQ